MLQGKVHMAQFSVKIRHPAGSVLDEKQHLWLKVDYVNSSGGRTKGTVMPLGLAQQGPRLYLACRFEGFDNNRILAVHRIRSAEVSTLPFDRPRDFSFTQFAEDGQFGFGDGKRVALEFQIAKDAGLHLTESPLSEDQITTDLGSELKVQATVVDSLLLDQWLLGFGDQIRNVKRRRTSIARKPPSHSIS